MDPLKELDPIPNKVIYIDDLPSLTIEDIEKGIIDKTVIQGWFDNKIRFIEIDGIWYAVLKDICDALDLKDPTTTSLRINPLNLRKGKVASKDVYRVENGSARPGQRLTQDMLLVDEAGIYQALFESRKLEARKFVQWTAGVLCKLREKLGLKPFECVRMTDKDIQDDIDFILDTLYWDDEKKCVMQSVTVQGGDVEQVVFSR